MDSGLGYKGAMAISSTVRLAEGAEARAGAEADDSRRAGTAGSTGLGGDRSATVGMLMATDDDCGN